MVDRAAKKAHSKQELVELLAAEIQSPKDREVFGGGGEIGAHLLEALLVTSTDAR